MQAPTDRVVSRVIVFNCSHVLDGYTLKQTHCGLDVSLPELQAVKYAKLSTIECEPCRIIVAQEVISEAQ